MHSPVRRACVVALFTSSTRSRGWLRPPWTVFDGGACGTLGAGLGGCALTTAPAVGGTGAVVWTMSGSLAPGGAGTVTFRVRVQ